EEAAQHEQRRGDRENGRDDDQRETGPAGCEREQHRARSTETALEERDDSDRAEREDLGRRVPRTEIGLVDAEAQAEPERQELHRDAETKSKETDAERVRRDRRS